MWGLVTQDVSRRRENGGRGAHGEREEGVVLEEDGNGTPEVVELERADVVSAEEDLALVGVVQACRQFEDRALPGTVRADDDLFCFAIHRTRVYMSMTEKQRTQSCPGRSLNEMFRRAHFSVSGYLKDTFLRPVRLYLDLQVT